MNIHWISLLCGLLYLISKMITKNPLNKHKVPTGKLVTENWAAPLLVKTETLSVPGFAVAKSGMPSQLKSAEVISKGKLYMVRGTVFPGENISNLLFKRIETSLVPTFAVAISIKPSPFKSAAVMAIGELPTE
nr:hypothetical protein [Cytobacillus praedii]